MPGTVLDTINLAFVVGPIDQANRDDVLLHIEGVVVAQGEGPFQRGVVDRPPEVDDLETLLEEPCDFLGREVAVDAGNGCLGRLVDVRLRGWLAGPGRLADLFWIASPDGYTKC